MRLAASILLLTVLCGCAISNHGVFPKLVWYWSVDAQLQREYDAHEKVLRQEYARTNRMENP